MWRKKVFLISFVLVLGLFLTSVVQAVIIDFESIPGGSPYEGLLISDQFLTTAGVSFSLEGGGFPVLAEVGFPLTAFEPGDTPAAGQRIGSFFLTDTASLSGDTPPAVIINYSIPTALASGVLLDIDFNERWTIEALDSAGVLLETINLNSGAPCTGDALATPWSFERSTNDISSIRLSGIRPGGAGYFGLGFDNFETGMTEGCDTKIDHNLVGWWKLNETSCNTAFDSSGNDNHGTLYGEPSWIVGRIDGALNFDGVDDYVSIQSLHYADSFYSEVSVGAWIRTSYPNNQVIVSFDRNEYWRLEINGDGGDPGQVGWDVMTSSGLVDYGSNTRIDDDNWHHVVGVFDNGTLTIYIDGDPEPSTYGGNTFGSGVVRYGFLGVGSEASVFNGNKRPKNWFCGDLDDVKIYDRALQLAEVNTLISPELRAHRPNPRNGARLVDSDADLSWASGFTTVAHDIYFGMDFNDVNEASRTNNMDLLVYQNYDVNFYDPGHLDLGVTYYWRIDEIGCPPNNTVYKGDTWSFRTCCQRSGRVVTILLTLSEPGLNGEPGPVDYMDMLLENAVNWVGKGMTDLNVLVIRDDNHQGEWTEDTDEIYNALVELGYNTSLLDEPEGGVKDSDLRRYDVVFLSNPGYPVDDLLTIQSLQNFFDMGGGIILQGDDICQEHTNLTTLTHLTFKDNGVDYFGHHTDDMLDEFYLVEIVGEHSVIAGLDSISFSYGDDIDSTDVTNTGEVVLAWATVMGTDLPKKPVITAYEAPGAIVDLIAVK